MDIVPQILLEISSNTSLAPDGRETASKWIFPQFPDIYTSLGQELKSQITPAWQLEYL